MSRIENRLRHMDLIVCHEAADEIERLRALLVDEWNAALFQNKRLRRLLKECQEYVEAGMSSVDSELCDRIEREAGDEPK